jgi:hypothetical protein
MAYEKIIVLLKTIQQRTDQGRIVWAETSKSGIYQASFPKNQVWIGMRQGDEQQGVVYVFGIHNENGTLIEEITHEDVTPEMGGGKEAFKFMKDLFEAARRRAMGVDQAIDDILSDLNPGNLPF